MFPLPNFGPTLILKPSKTFVKLLFGSDFVWRNFGETLSDILFTQFIFDLKVRKMAGIA